jgi:hypothetical protein
MDLYTLVAKEKKKNNNYKLLGSTFESDVAIFLYFSNKEKYEELYFVFTRSEFNDFNQFSDFSEETLTFFVKLENNKINKLLFNDKSNIYKLQSPYFTESLICSRSEDENEQLDYSEIVCDNEKYKKELFPFDYKTQDEEFFEHHYEAEVLYVSVLTYGKNGEEHTCLGSASYNEESTAYLLDTKINEINPDWSHYYFKPMFIFKIYIKKYLRKNLLHFCSYSEEPESKLALIPLEADEEYPEAKLYECQYITLSEINEDDFENFIEKSWDKYELQFNVFDEKEYEQNFGGNLSKEDIITAYISELHKYYLPIQEDWKDCISLFKKLVLRDDIEISINCNILESSTQYNENLERVFLYLKDCIQISIDNDLYDNLAIGILIKQKTGLKINNEDLKRAAGYILYRSGIQSLSVDNLKEFIYEESDVNFYVEKNTKYLDSQKLFSILNLDYILK